jgi:hypothetical protein
MYNASNYLKLLCLRTLYFSSQRVFLFFIHQHCEYEWCDEEKERKKIRREQNVSELEGEWF